jgi:glycosyltransferase involved in cell wall biosynthesis
MTVELSTKDMSLMQVSEIPTGQQFKTTRRRDSVLFVSVNTFYGGGEKHVENLARLFKDSCGLCAIVFHPTLARNLRAQGVQVYQLSLFPESARALQVLQASLMLPLIILHHKISVVQVTGTMEVLLLPASRALGCAAISIRHLAPFFGDGAWYRRLRRLLIETVYSIGLLFANRVICVSDAVGTGMRRMTANRRIAVIPNWVPVVPPRKPRVVNKETLCIVFVGRLERHKGLHLLLEALRPLTGYELKVLGDGSERCSLEHLATGLNVQFCGFQSNPSNYYRDADIFIMPSLGPEGLPLVTIEAMSYGLPCILSDLPVHREMSSNDAAILFTCGNPRDLRSQVLRLLRSESERRKYGEAAYEAVLKRYSPDVARAHYLSVFGLSDAPQREPEHARQRL